MPSARKAGQDVGARRSIADTLYPSIFLIGIGALGGTSVSLTVAYLAHDMAITAVAILICAVALVRIGATALYRRFGPAPLSEAARRWETGHEAGAWAYAALLGLLAFVTLVRTDDPTLQLLTTCLVVGYSGGLSGREAGRVQVAIGQLMLALSPAAIGLWLEGGLGNRVLAALLLVMAASMARLSSATHGMVTQALLGQQEKTSLAKKYERLARFDALTGVENRMAMQMRLHELFAANRKRQNAVAVIWIDLDRFKEINDMLGHMIGDELLCVVAEKLSRALDGRGHIARFGGDEFVLICPDADRVTAQGIARDVTDHFRDGFDIAGQHLTVTVSLGIAVAPQDGQHADELMQHADMALYEAKRDGGNRAVCFTWAMKERFNRIHDIESGLRRSIENGELAVYYQPIFDLATGKVTTCEALLRWDHPQLGRIPPSEFIPAAENIGVIDEISAWVLREACAAAMGWPADIRVAVNISPASLKSGDLPRTVIATLLETGLVARRLELEVTETVFLEESRHTSLMLRELQRIGLKLVLDDFGTGYSSLSYLRNYRFDTIKIDQSFMTGIRDSPEGQAIVRAVRHIAQALNMETVAEGIETEDQLSYAREAGFNGGQGFLLCQPQTHERILELMKEGLRIAPAPPHMVAGRRMRA